MVQISLLPIASMAILFSFAAARNCTPGLIYCGHTLDNIGDYESQIAEALNDAHQPVDGAHKSNSRFYCDGGSHGDITFLSFCDKNCIDGGRDKNDYCS